MGKIIDRIRERENAAIERRIKMLKYPEIGSPKWNAKIEEQLRHARVCLGISKRSKKPTLWQRIFGKAEIYYRDRWAP